MKLVDHMPSDGQFVAIWENNGEIWADTMRVKDGKTQMLESNGEWRDCECTVFLNEKQAKYVITGDE